jgi:hypothetical protein
MGDLNGWFIAWENPFFWMIWGFPHFRNPPYIYIHICIYIYTYTIYIDVHVAILYKKANAIHDYHDWGLWKIPAMLVIWRMVYHGVYHIIYIYLFRRVVAVQYIHAYICIHIHTLMDPSTFWGFGIYFRGIGTFSDESFSAASTTRPEPVEIEYMQRGSKARWWHTKSEFGFVPSYPEVKIWQIQVTVPGLPVN